MKPGFSRTLALLSAIVIGACCPWAHVFSGLIRWLVLGMLFIVFLGTTFSHGSIKKSHIWIVIINLAMGGVGYALGWIVGGHEVAISGFFAGIAPTATAAAVIMGFLGGRVEYVVTSFVLTNVLVSMLLPVMMPLAIGHAAPAAFGDVAKSVGTLVFAPLVVALVLQRIYPGIRYWPSKVKNLSFGMWVLALFLIMGNTCHFLRTQGAGVSLFILVELGVVSALVCAANFALGRLVGGREFGREASQSLGQKNTTLTIYLAMTYVSPLVALGPTFYVIWHNLWNSWQLQRQARATAGTSDEAGNQNTK